MRSKKKSSKKDVKRQSKLAISIYRARKIAIKQLNANNEFNCIVDEIRPISVNIVSAGEYVGDTERSNRTVKEYTRYHVH